ncbi:MAG: hypothetical protein E6H66_02040 [Betaproteobacteria bacterium]|nr:MAG: hypothetical protein E6H66_02040 [Betaproteobacteria bacterium]
MRPLIHLPPWRRWLASVLAALVGLGPLATPGYAALTALGDQPLSVQNQAKPNIMLTVDDSTSMLYDFLPDAAISKYCRDITGNMNAACGRLDSNTDLTFGGHGKYQTAGYVYEQFGLPFPAYNGAARKSAARRRLSSHAVRPREPAVSLRRARAASIRERCRGSSAIPRATRRWRAKCTNTGPCGRRPFTTPNSTTAITTLG